MKVGDWVVSDSGIVCGQIVKFDKDKSVGALIWIKIQLVDGTTTTLPYTVANFKVIPEPIAKIILSNIEQSTKF